MSRLGGWVGARAKIALFASCARARVHGGAASAWVTASASVRAHARSHLGVLFARVLVELGAFGGLVHDPSHVLLVDAAHPRLLVREDVLMRIFLALLHFAFYAASRTGTGTGT